MTRKDAVIVAMAVSGGAPHSPVQIQKLMFLLDRKIPSLFQGRKFNFKPYNYGPFDQAVYGDLQLLADEGHVEILEITELRHRTYRLTPSGQRHGQLLLQQMDGKLRGYIERISEFVRSVSFSELVSAIYHEYPDMKKNSVFQE
jgi:hypothetical protein